MIQKYTQSTYETCLACCLLQAIGRSKPLKLSRRLELDCINHSMKFSKNDFVIGHLDYIIKKFNTNVIRIVDNQKFYNYLKDINQSPKIKIEHRKINLNLIDKLLDKRPILYIDAYSLFKVYHYPHFVTILDKIVDNYKIFDTWDGKEKTTSGEMLSKSISSLRNRIRLCPQILLVEALS